MGLQLTSAVGRRKRLPLALAAESLYVGRTTVRVPEHALATLRSAGLVLSRPMIATHAAMPSGIRVGKPAAIPGNSVPGHVRSYQCFGDVLVELPTLCIFGKDGAWHVDAMDGWGGVAPGDFHNSWRSCDELIQDVLDFFFGDPVRMLAKTPRRPRSG